MISKTKFIFIEGIDGAGKSTCVRGLKRRIEKHLGKTCIVVNRETPREYKVLFNLDSQYGIKSTKLAKLSYRAARLNLVTRLIKVRNPDFAIFDRGFLHILVKSEIEKLTQKNLPGVFVDDILNSLSSCDYSILHLEINVNDAIKRNKERRNPSPSDLDAKYLQSCKSILRKYFLSYMRPGIDLGIDVSHLSKRKLNDILFEFIR